MNRETIEATILRIFADRFEIEDPDPDAHLRDRYEFDSIDAIELLATLETEFSIELTQDEKKQAMEIRTVRQVFDYTERMIRKRCGNKR